MDKCWSGFCIASAHPNTNDHVDTTGYTWTEKQHSEVVDIVIIDGSPITLQTSHATFDKEDNDY